MKTLLIIALLSCGFCASIKSQEYTTPNVLSYYAMGNSIDGQPMIEMANVLRFYPVFALRAFTDTVIVTVYYGPYVYTDTARPMGDKHYWEARLPRFELGEAIQRIDVRTTINIKDHPIQKKINDLDIAISSSLQELNDLITSSLKPLKTEFQKIIKSTKGLDEKINNYIIPEADTKAISEGLNSLKQNLEDKIKNYIIPEDEIKKIIESTKGLDEKIIPEADTKAISEGLNSLKQNLEDKIKNYIIPEDEIKKINNFYYINNIKNIKEIKDKISAQTHSFIRSIENFINLLDIQNDALKKQISDNIINGFNSIRTNIANENLEQITDTNYSGPSVRKGDVLISEDKNHVQILYRNHKTSLRQLPALDPVESMGLFRIRYIPFVIAGENLMTTFTGDNSAVFEIGLAFGDVRVSGDDFVKPELSIRRLGVAFAITNRLFGDDARVRALALTYDFNSYGSIAAGVNFPGKDVASGTINESYISFGINKRAFEQLLKGLTGLF